MLYIEKVVMEMPGFEHGTFQMQSEQYTAELNTPLCEIFCKLSKSNLIVFLVIRGDIQF